MFVIDTLALAAILGVFLALIFSVIFWVQNGNISNKLFSVFLVATSIRIAKNILVHLTDLNPELFDWGAPWRISVYIGITHQFAIGPLFYLYFVSKLSSDFIMKRTYWWHFLPFGIFLILSFFVRWDFWKYGGLWLSYISILAYYLLAFRYFILNKNGLEKNAQKWLNILLSTTALLLIAYSPILFHYLGYIGGGVLYMISLLVAGYIMVSSKNGIPFFKNKYESSSLSTSEIERIKTKLEEQIHEHKIFLNPELTLDLLAKSISSKPHHVSRVINQEFGKSFSEYINLFRIEEAATRLSDSNYNHLKISALAYECGFNSVPTFNTLFKKVYKTTPSKFRDRL